jgi:hypothetical protein
VFAVKDKTSEMKNSRLLFILLAVAVAVTSVSCTTTQNASEESYEGARQVGNRLYIDDPYRGTVVLERDPYTGRYYDVTNSYGYNYGSRYNSPFGYDNTYRNSRYSRTYDRGTYQRPQPQPTEDQRKNWENQRQEARKKVLGN